VGVIPIGDDVQVRSFPKVTFWLVGINLVMFLIELLIGPAMVIHLLGFVPLRFLEMPAHPLTWFSVLSAMFLHAGWGHLLGNLLYLAIFGSSLERWLGGRRLLVLYFLGGLGAELLHGLALMESPGPAVGASGAIAALLGAYLLHYPQARILTLVPILIFAPIIRVPAWLSLIWWFFQQYISVLLQTYEEAIYGGGTGWWAHIGGFMVGMLAVVLVWADLEETSSEPPSFEDRVRFHISGEQ
jgi:membrane associated rhomboid family serine protease